MDTIKIGISIGDINGIGLEVIIKTLKDNLLFKNFAPVIYGSPKIVSYHKNITSVPELNLNQIKSAEQAQKGVVNIITCWQENVNITLGAASAESGKYSVISLTEATKDPKAGLIDALVTAPIQKQSVYSDNFPYRGHTEYFAKEFDSSYLMLLTSQDLKVGVATGHIPLKDVSKSITKELIFEKVRILHRSLARDFGFEKGKIAVLGLNPHSGDDGLIGDEDEKIIRPAIIELKNQGVMVYGPYSSDGFFGSGQFKKFDAILAMYHDQGLIPFKTLAFNDGVNYSAGLPFVRTSPDHGTGYDIAGKNIADEGSFRKALLMAFDIVRNRKEYDKDHKNPIVKKERNFEDEIVKEDHQ